MNVVDGVYMRVKPDAFVFWPWIPHCTAGQEVRRTSLDWDTRYLVHPPCSMVGSFQKDTSSSQRTGHVEGSLEQDGKGVATMWETSQVVAAPRGPSTSSLGTQLPDDPAQIESGGTA